MTEQFSNQNSEECTETTAIEAVQPVLTLREKVFLVCTQFQNSGEKITRNAIREHTGGSDRDLSKYIAEWRESQALVVQENAEIEQNSGTDSDDVSSKNLNSQSSYSNKPKDDIAVVARRAAERATAMIIGEDAVVSHLLENPDSLPPDLKEQVEIYRARIAEANQHRQNQYVPDFFAEAAIAQFQ